MRYEPLVQLQDALELIRKALYESRRPTFKPMPGTGLPIVITEVISTPCLAQFVRDNLDMNTRDLAFQIQQYLRSLLSEMKAMRFLRSDFDVTRVDVLVEIRRHHSMYDDRRLLMGIAVAGKDQWKPIERYLVNTAYNGIYELF